jgi:acetyl-CoA C-acetyltransferase
MRKIAIIGIGQTSVDEHWGKSLKELAGEAIFAAMLDANRPSAECIFVGNMLSGMLSKQENIGSLIADWSGMRGVEAVKIEAACASGGAALRAGIHAVSSGSAESAIVVGVEKMTETLPAEMTAALATAADSDWEAAQGLSFVAINALIMQRYMYEYGWEQQDFAPFSINAHQNALCNPFARLRFPITEKEYSESRVIAAPINLLDASPIGDGAAALFIVPSESLSSLPGKITIEASAVATDTLAVHSRHRSTWLQAGEESSRKAYQQSGLTPADIDLFEYHDAFTIMAALSLEAAGFVPIGQAPRLALDGQLSPHGKLPVATLGGLKARGHPVGATGVYQIVEIVEQLREMAGETQVENARVGMAQNIGGSGATIVTHILKRDD